MEREETKGQGNGKGITGKGKEGKKVKYWKWEKKGDGRKEEMERWIKRLPGSRDKWKAWEKGTRERRREERKNGKVEKKTTGKEGERGGRGKRNNRKEERRKKKMERGRQGLKKGKGKMGQQNGGTPQLLRCCQAPQVSTVVFHRNTDQNQYIKIPWQT